MKLTAPKNPDEYFTQTAGAVKHTYAGLDACWAHYQEALRHYDPLDPSKVNKPMTPERKAAIDGFLEHAGKYFEQKFSEAMHAGAILQAAHMAIRLYSRNTVIPSSCTALVSQGSPVTAFCIGRERHGIPSGLIVYAGRNQYNHWDDDEAHRVTANVFQALTDAFRDNMFKDLAFDLGNPMMNPIYAGEILLAALGWRSYDTYLSEMKAMLS